MSLATFVYFRHRTDSTTGIIDLPMFSNSIDKSISFKIKEGDVIEFKNLKDADQVAIKKFTKEVPSSMVVKSIVLENDLEIKNGIRKIYLERI